MAYIAIAFNRKSQPGLFQRAVTAKRIPEHFPAIFCLFPEHQKFTIVK
jgi:hypothetical protein